jgi:hypothetical protein
MHDSGNLIPHWHPLPKRWHWIAFTGTVNWGNLDHAKRNALHAKEHGN